MRFNGMLLRVNPSADLKTVLIRYGPNRKLAHADRTDIITSLSRLHAGKHVTFEAHERERFDKATNVLLSEDETDQSLIRILILHKEEDAWLPVITRQMQEASLDFAVEITMLCLNVRANSQERLRLLELIPDRLLEASAELRSQIVVSKRIGIYGKILEENPGCDHQKMVDGEIVPLISGMTIEERGKHLGLLPSSAISAYSSLRGLVSLEQRLTIYRSQLQTPEKLTPDLRSEIVKAVLSADFKSIEAFTQALTRDTNYHTWRELRLALPPAIRLPLYASTAPQKSLAGSDD